MNIKDDSEGYTAMNIKNEATWSKQLKSKNKDVPGWIGGGQELPNVDGFLVLQIKDGRAMLSTVVPPTDKGDLSVSYKPVKNWQYLEKEALRAIRKQGGDTSEDGLWYAPAPVIDLYYARKSRHHT
jgi:hypothetical protein